MAVGTLTVKISIAWWFKAVYLPLVLGGAAITGLEPNMEKVSWWIARAVKVEAA